MKLAGRFRIVIEGDLADQVTAGGRSTNVIGYLMERLLTGQAAAVETELETWGIRVRDGRGMVDRAQLREATEDDVAEALRNSYVEDVLAGVGQPELLEFFNRMLDQRIGEEDDCGLSSYGLIRYP